MRVQFLWRFSWDTPKTPQQPKSGGEWVWGVYVSHAINFAPAPGGGALVPYKHHKAPVRQTNSRNKPSGLPAMRVSPTPPATHHRHEKSNQKCRKSSSPPIHFKLGMLLTHAIAVAALRSKRSSCTRMVLFFSAAYLPYPTAAESAGSAITTMDPPFVVGCGCSSVDVWAEMHRTSDSHVSDLFLDRCGYI